MPKISLSIARGIGEYTKREIYRLAEQKDRVEVLEVNVQADHVHMVLSIAPKYKVSDVVGYLKSKLAVRVFYQYPHLRQKRYGGNHRWSRGYCVTTVGVDEEKIRKYVRWQEQKEKQHEQFQKRLFD